MKITVLYSLPTKRSLTSEFAETDVETGDSAKEVENALIAKGHQVEVVALPPDNLEIISNINADLIFNLIEWTSLDLPIAKRAFEIIEKTGIPYTGATWENYLLTSDKSLLKKELDRHKLPTARWQLFTTGKELPRSDFDYPLIVKPTLEHCSIGLSEDAIAKDRENLVKIVNKKITQFQQPMIAEEFIDGRELQVTLIVIDQKPKILPPCEIWFETKGTEAFLSYASRWEEKSAEYETSHLRLPKLPPEISQKLEDICLTTFTKLNYRDYGRFDLRMRNDEIFILEANSNPGLGDTDEYAMTVSYKAAGMTFADYIEAIVQSALDRKSAG